MEIGIKDAVILSIFCILIVFIILMVISLGINLIKIFLYSKSKIIDHKKEEYVREVKKHLEDSHKIKFEDIDDEDMLIAAFVASIDSVEENDNKSVRIKSIKRL